MQQTDNYQLSQWDMTDRIQMGDFNEDNRKIDEALATQAAELSAQAAKLAKCGNCRIYHTSYTGNGSSGVSGPCSVTFPGTPLFVAVNGMSCSATYVYGGNMYVQVPSAQVICTASLSGDGKTLSWYTSVATEQMNMSGATYYVTALMAAE